MNRIDEIARTIRAAREAKGLSQRALAERAGLPQSHISRIENAGVDLRISSLSEIARALDLEVALVPRKAVPAVKSIVRSARPSPQGKGEAALAKELTKMESLADQIAQHSSLKEVAQLQSRIHDLTRFDMPDAYLHTLKKMNRQLQEISKGEVDSRRIVESLESAQRLRNALAHSPRQELQRVSRSAYSLEEEGG